MQGIVKLGRPFGFPDNAVDRQALHAGHGWNGSVVAVIDEQRPDQIVGRKHALTHHASRPFGPPVAAHAYRQIERGSIGCLACLLFDRHEADFPLQRSAELYGHKHTPGVLLARPIRPRYPLSEE